MWLYLTVITSLKNNVKSHILLLQIKCKVKTELSTNRKNKTPIKSYHYIKIIIPLKWYNV